MIVDHLVTRSVVRSVAMVFTAITPLAAAYFLYLFAYNETPLDTLAHQIPLVLKLLQDNTTSLASTKQFHYHHQQYLLPGPHVTTTSALSPLNSMPAGATSLSATLSKSSSAVDCYYGSSSSNNFSPPHHLPPCENNINTLSLSPAMSGLVALVALLDDYGYDHPNKVIPGYQYLTTLLQPLQTGLRPVIAFVTSDRMLAWMASLLHFWMAMEILFYIHFWTRLGQAQTVDRVPKGPRNRQERKELFRKCIDTIGKGPRAKRWAETWFDTGKTSQKVKFEDIGRSNMMQWLAWAFWVAETEEVLASPTDKMDLLQMLDTIERSKGIKFAEGHNPDIECIRLAFDPVVASHRPLIYYTLVWITNAITALLLYILGFSRFEGTVDHHRTNLPFNYDPLTDLSYWYRASLRPDNKVPLVFIHGIGVGLVQYAHWIVALSTLSRPVILIEVPYVANSFFKTECMSPDETYFALERILKRHNYPKATFMGHSLGTMLCAAVCRASSATSPKSIVHGLVLADPICFLTHHSIARNFAYRAPSTANELIMDLFAAREIGTSWFIMRRFCWNQCIMFPVAWKRRFEKRKEEHSAGVLSPVLPKMTRVFLSRQDNLLDMGLVAEYLKQQVGLSEERGELHVMEDLDHAAFLLRPSWFWKVLKAAEEC